MGGAREGQTEGGGGGRERGPQVAISRNVVAALLQRTQFSKRNLGNALPEPAPDQGPGARARDAGPETQARAFSNYLWCGPPWGFHVNNK